MGDASEENPLDVFCDLEQDLDRDAPLPHRRGARRVPANAHRAPEALRRWRHGDGTARLGPGGGGLPGRARRVGAVTGRSPGKLRHSDEAELRELLRVLGMSRHGPTWMGARAVRDGLHREAETEALSDYLLGIRALLFRIRRGRGSSLRRRGSRACARRMTSDSRSRPRSVPRARASLIYGQEEGDSSLTLDSPHALVPRRAVPRPAPGPALRLLSTRTCTAGRRTARGPRTTGRGRRDQRARYAGG